MKRLVRPTLVTGLHRSGTKWVGTMISLSPQVRYVSEPLNPNQPGGIGMCSAEFDQWYTHISCHNESNYEMALLRTLRLDYNLIPALLSIRNFQDLRRYLSEYLKTTRCKWRGGVPVLKDPFALFSAEWMAAKLGMNVLVLIRHPAAFASSVKSRHWHFDFNNFSDQPVLMEKLLGNYEDEIHDFARNKRSLIDQANLLWKISHHVIAGYRNNHPDWQFLRHEDISYDPEQHFKFIYDHLGLEFTEKIQAEVNNYSRLPVFQKTYSSQEIRRNSLANVARWKDELSKEEVTRIRKSVEEVSSQFYDDSDW